MGNSVSLRERERETRGLIHQKINLRSLRINWNVIIPPQIGIVIIKTTFTKNCLHWKNAEKNCRQNSARSHGWRADEQELLVLIPLFNSLMVEFFCCVYIGIQRERERDWDKGIFNAWIFKGWKLYIQIMAPNHGKVILLCYIVISHIYNKGN